jgi:hypothetical protein
MPGSTQYSERLGQVLKHSMKQGRSVRILSQHGVRTVRQECLNHIIILNEANLQRVLNEFVLHYNTARPHQGLHQQAPIPPPRVESGSRVHRRDRLGGIIHEYFREVA